MASYLYDSVLDSKIFVVIYDYKAHVDGDVNLQAGEQVENLSDFGGWCQVKRNDHTCYIPKTYLAQLNTVEAEKWYFPGIARQEAEELLITEEPGTYLVRPSSTPKDFSLSLRTALDIKPVVHYKINYDRDSGFYIHKELKEMSLRRLLHFYQNDVKNRLNIAHILRIPCPNRNPPPLYELVPQNKAFKSEEIKTLDVVGKGNFGRVYRGFYRQFQVAVKELTNENDSQEWDKEMRPFLELRHKNVVTYYGFCAEKHWMVFEFVDYCLIDQLKVDAYNNNQLLIIALHVARGMEYVHSMEYIHRDLAARNILVTAGPGQLCAKLSDFGLSRKLDTGIYQMKQKGSTPYRWEALESLEDKTYNKSTDVWSYGVLLHEIYKKGATPYSEIKGSPILILFLRDGKRLDRPEKMPSTLYNFQLSCWHKDPRKRPSFMKVVQFLTKLSQ